MEAVAALINPCMLKTECLKKKKKLAGDNYRPIMLSISAIVSHFAIMSVPVGTITYNVMSAVVFSLS